MRLRTPLSTTLALVAGMLTTLAVSPSPASATGLGCGSSCTTVLDATGALQHYTVPSGATRLQVQVDGAQGGGFPLGPAGGKGGRTSAVVAVDPGDVLDVVVGSQGGTGGVLALLGHAFGGGGQAGSFLSVPSGGGGGGSFLYDAAGSLLVAAGGGGGSTLGAAGGLGGAVGALATAGTSPVSGAGGGQPATAVANGLGGAAAGVLGSVAGLAGSGGFPGSMPVGGSGGSALTSGAGGGGGYFAGGGGGSVGLLSSLLAGGGGGGAGFAAPAATLVDGVRGIVSGNGKVTITALGPLLEQVLSFVSSPPATPLVGGTYQPTVLNAAGLPTTLAVDPASSAVCSLASGTVSFLAPGDCVLNASALGTLLYLPGSVQQVIHVKAAQLLSFASTPPSGALPGDTYDVVASATSGLTPTLAVDPSSSAVCSLAGGTVTFLAPGQCTLVATQLGNVTYALATAVQQVVTVFAPPVAVCDGSTADAGCAFHWVEQSGATSRTCVLDGGCAFLDDYAGFSVADAAHSYFHDAGTGATAMCVGAPAADWGSYGAGDLSWASLSGDAQAAFHSAFASATACSAELTALTTPTAAVTTPVDGATYTSGTPVTFAAQLHSVSPGPMTCSFSVGSTTVPGTVDLLSSVCTADAAHTMVAADQAVAVHATDSSQQVSTDSSTVTVTAAQVDTTTTATAPTRGVVGKRVTVRGTLTRTGGAPVEGGSLRLYAAVGTGIYRAVGTALTTDASGTVSTAVRLTGTTRFQWRAAGSSTPDLVLNPSTSDVRTVAGLPRLSLKAGASAATVTVGVRGVKVLLRIDGKARGKAVKVPASGKVRFAYPRLKGRHTFVVTTKDTPRYAAAKLIRKVRL